MTDLLDVKQHALSVIQGRGSERFGIMQAFWLDGDNPADHLAAMALVLDAELERKTGVVLVEREWRFAESLLTPREWMEADD